MEKEIKNMELEMVPVSFPLFTEESPVIKEIFTVKEVNDLVSTIAQYISEDLSIAQWTDKMLVHCGHNPNVFYHSTSVIRDALIKLFNNILQDKQTR